MCELTGEVADGLIGHPVWSVEWALGQAQESVAVGAARTGRDPAKIHFQPWVTASIDPDEKNGPARRQALAGLLLGLQPVLPLFRGARLRCRGAQNQCSFQDDELRAGRAVRAG